MERFLDDVTEAWPIQREPHELQGRTGECLGNLNVLPDLAPCYVATDRALILGWNRRSLELALLTEPDRSRRGSSRAVIHLDRMPEADERRVRPRAQDP